MTMNRLGAAVLATALIVAAGCKSTAARVIDPGTEGIVSVGEVDIQDLTEASADMLESLVAEGVLRQAPSPPALILMGRIVNDTSSQFSMDELTYRIRDQLSKTGQARVVTIGGYGTSAEDKAAQERAKADQFFNDGTKPSPVAKPHFSLTGRITQVKRRVDDVRQTTYTFRLTLTDMVTGQEVWTNVKSKTKQGEQSGISL